MLVMHARVFSLRNDDSLKKRCMDLKQKSNIFFTFFFVPKDIEKKCIYCLCIFQLFCTITKWISHSPIIWKWWDIIGIEIIITKSKSEFSKMWKASSSFCYQMIVKSFDAFFYFLTSDPTAFFYTHINTYIKPKDDRKPNNCTSKNNVFFLCLWLLYTIYLIISYFIGH